VPKGIKKRYLAPYSRVLPGKKKKNFLKERNKRVIGRGEEEKRGSFSFQIRAQRGGREFWKRIACLGRADGARQHFKVKGASVFLSGKNGNLGMKNHYQV